MSPTKNMCLVTILIAAKDSDIARLRYQNCEKAVSLPKIPINIFDVLKEVGGGGGGRGRSPEKRTIDVYRYMRLPLNITDNIGCVVIIFPFVQTKRKHEYMLY